MSRLLFSCYMAKMICKKYCKNLVCVWEGDTKATQNLVNLIYLAIGLSVCLKYHIISTISSMNRWLDLGARIPKCTIDFWQSKHLYPTLSVRFHKTSVSCTDIRSVSVTFVFSLVFFFLTSSCIQCLYVLRVA